MTKFRADAALDILFRPRGGAENGKVAYIRAEAGEAFELTDAKGEPLNDEELEVRFEADLAQYIPGLTRFEDEPEIEPIVEGTINGQPVVENADGVVVVSPEGSPAGSEGDPNATDTPEPAVEA